ncbi:MAG: hypothetical protein ACK4R6_09300 [Spirosomataceae bacterium]
MPVILGQIKHESTQYLAKIPKYSPVTNEDPSFLTGLRGHIGL